MAKKLDVRSSLVRRVRRHKHVLFAAVLLLLCAGIPALVAEWHLLHPWPGKFGNSTMCAAEFAKVLERLDKQKDQRSEWAYAAIVAIVAISVVKRTFNMPWIRPAYVLLGTAGALLLQSIRAGDLYERHAAGLVRQSVITEKEFGAVNRLLWWQLSWLNYAALALLIFVAAFLVAVISGKVEMKGDAND